MDVAFLKSEQSHSKMVCSDRIGISIKSLVIGLLAKGCSEKKDKKYINGGKE